jgi:hypothetical protein
MCGRFSCLRIIHPRDAYPKWSSFTSYERLSLTYLAWTTPELDEWGDQILRQRYAENALLSHYVSAHLGYVSGSTITFIDAAKSFRCEFPLPCLL